MASAVLSSSNSSSLTLSPSCTSYKSPPATPLFPVRSLSLSLSCSPNSIAGSEVSNFFSDCFLTSTMARSSSRLKEKRNREENGNLQSSAITPPTQNTTSQQSASQKSASQQSSIRTTKRTPIRNPYKKVYSAQKRRPPPSEKPSAPSMDDEIIEVNLPQPRIEPQPQRFKLSIPVEFRPTGIAPHLLPLQPNTLDGSIDFTSIVAPQSEQPFSLPSILKSMQDNPIVAFGNIDVSHLTKNSDKYQKERTIWK